ncbi:MAG: hypothetical protein UZ14_CFX002001898 [Chloroflexi bacterium OLB14]|nr:MAG: hypothetical protein UZ14_CFX002001898 [Chloroflexi bacterium OLB14]
MFYVTVCLPMFIWVIGLILAIVRWKQSPRKSILVLIGLSIMLLGGLTDIAQNFIHANNSHMMNYTSFTHVFSIIGVFFDTLGWVLCIIAIFYPRQKRR